MLICSKKDCTCLHHKLLDCIKKGESNEAKLFLRKLDNFGYLADDLGFTFLHYSVKYKNESMTKYLIKVGCNINAQDNAGFTPLMLAIKKKHAANVKVLLKHNADIYLTTNNGISTLQLALHCCLGPWLTDSIKQDALTISKILFERMNEDLSTRTIRLILRANNTMKLAVVVLGHVRLADIILKHGYPVDFQEPVRGCTALHCAIIFAKVNNAKMLLEYAAKVDVPDKRGKLPLSYYTPDFEAVDENSEVLKTILKSRVRLDAANQRLYKDLAEHWIQFGMKETVKAMIHCGIDKGRCSDYGRSYLHLMVENENDDVIDLLDEPNFEFRLNSHDWFGHTPLMIAALRGSVRKVKALLQRGADVNRRTTCHKTALFFAAIQAFPANAKERKSYATITELLLQHGADALLAFDDGVASGTTYIDWLPRGLSTKVIVAHVALISTFDRSSLTRKSVGQIQSDPTLREYFDLCSRQLEEMKSVKVYESVTLTEFLTVGEDKVMALARNQEFILAVNNMVEDICYLEPYYLSTLQNRISNAVYNIELHEKAAVAIGQLTGLFDVTHKIISYLNLQDLHSFSIAYNIQSV